MPLRTGAWTICRPFTWDVARNVRVGLKALYGRQDRCFGAAPERKTVRARKNPQFSVRPQLLTADVERLLDCGREASFYCDGSEMTGWQSAKKIDFGSGGFARPG